MLFTGKQSSDSQNKSQEKDQAANFCIGRIPFCGWSVPNGSGRAENISHTIAGIQKVKIDVFVLDNRRTKPA